MGLLTWIVYDVMCIIICMQIIELLKHTELCSIGYPKQIKYSVCLLFYARPTVCQLYHGNDMMYQMRTRKAKSNFPDLRDL